MLYFPSLSKHLVSTGRLRSLLEKCKLLVGFDLEAGAQCSVAEMEFCVLATWYNQ